MKTLIISILFSLFLISAPVGIFAQETDSEDTVLKNDSPMENMEEPLAKGEAIIKGTSADSPISGTVTLKEFIGGVKIEAELANVPPGKHGFHIHENGSCDDAGTAAGGHYNPANVPHGFLNKDGLSHAHAGDIGNIEIDENGTGALSAFLPGLSLTSGEYNVAGKTFILHEKEDDGGQPTGNAGGRIGCGVINVSGKLF